MRIPPSLVRHAVHVGSGWEAEDRLGRDGEPAHEFARDLLTRIGYTEWLRESCRDARQAERCLENARTLIASLDTVREKVIGVFGTGSDAFGESSDPDRMIYSGGFFSAADRNLMNKILALSPRDLRGHLFTFQDKRLSLMLFRYRARNYPDSLTDEERARWEEFRFQRLTEPDAGASICMGDYQEEIQELLEGGDLQASQVALMEELLEFAQQYCQDHPEV